MSLASTRCRRCRRRSRPDLCARYGIIDWLRVAVSACVVDGSSAEGAVAGECFDVGAVCDGAGSVLWAWLISSDDQQTSSEVFAVAHEVVEISYIIQIHTYIKIYMAPKS